jgi:hypothetical protein
MLRTAFLFFVAVLFASADVRVSGTVIDPDGSPSSGAGVSLRNPADQRAIYETTTDSLGTFRIDAVAPRSYFVVIRSRTFDGEYWDAVTVAPEQAVNLGKISFPLPKYPLSEIYIDPATRPKRLDDDVRDVHGSRVLTVCQYLSFRAKEPLSYPTSVIVIGILVKTPEGSWLRQSCRESLRSGDYIWPNAIALEGETRSTRIPGPYGWADYLPHLSQPSDADMEASDRDGKWAAFIGRLETRDKLVAVPCGDGKVCANGYGPISAPARLIYKQSYEFPAPKQ